MIYVLIAVLLAMLMIEFLLNKKSILAPGCITIEVFLISLIVTALSMKTWGYPGISVKTGIVILTAILALCIGEFIVNFWFDKNEDSLLKNHTNPLAEKRIEYPWWSIILIIILMSIMIALKYLKVCEVTETLGESIPLLERLHLMRGIVTSATYNAYGSIIKVCSAISSGIAWITSFIFLYNAANRKFKAIDCILLIPILLNIFMCILGTGRDYFISISSGILLMLFALVLQNKESSMKISFVFIVGAVLVLAAFLAFFSTLGRYSGMEQIKDTVAFYIGSPIPSLDEYLSRPWVKPSYFGEETLYGVYNALRKLRIYETEAHVMQLEWPGISTPYYSNIYTSLRRLIHDYGYAGMYIVQFLAGMLYTIIYRLAISKKKIDLAVIAWGFIGYAIVEQSIEERLLTVLLGSNTVYVWFVIIGMYLLVRLYNSKKESNRYE